MPLQFSNPAQSRFLRSWTTALPSLVAGAAGFAGLIVAGARIEAGLVGGLCVLIATALTPLIARRIGLIKALPEEVEKALNESRERLAAIVESSEDAIIGKDLDGIVTSWNTGAERLLGYTAEEMLGTPIMRLLPPDHQAEETLILARIRRGEKVDHFETVRLSKDGRLIDVSVAVSPIRDELGAVIGASKVMRDIGERLRTRKALRESEDRMQIVVENLTEGLVIANAGQELLHWNRAALEMHGFTNPREVRRRFTAFVESFQLLQLDGTLVPITEWPLARIFRGEHLRNLALRIRRIDTEWERVFSFGGALVEEAEGGPLAFVIINDITERARAEEERAQLNASLEERVAERTAQLESANQELEAFSYSVSHDLRAPLRAVDGYSQAVLEDYGSKLPEEGRRYLKTIREGAQRMGVLIDDLLTFSRLSRLPLRRQNVSTARVVGEVLQELSAEREGRQVEITVRDLRESWADPALLKQVWVNLLSNACKYTRHRPAACIEIGCEATEQGEAWFVRDNGAGFDMRYAGKLFGVFQRLHRAEDYEGTGVGLAIVQRIVHRHGGHVWAQAAVEQGATFYFTLQKGMSS